jgi:hypothetical protein
MDFWPILRVIVRQLQLKLPSETFVSDVKGFFLIFSLISFINVCVKLKGTDEAGSIYEILWVMKDIADLHALKQHGHSFFLKFEAFLMICCLGLVLLLLISSLDQVFMKLLLIIFSP